jgi:hypothetical protein
MFGCCGNRDDEKTVRFLTVNLSADKSLPKVTYEKDMLPLLKDDEVLIKVQFSTISVRDKSKFEGEKGIGNTFSGTVKTKGVKVTNFNAGDLVYGWYEKGWGSVADSVVVPADHIIATPPGITQDIASTLPILQIWAENANETMSQFATTHIQCSNPLIKSVLEDVYKSFPSPMPLVEKEKANESIELYYYVDGDVIPQWEKSKVQVSYDITEAGHFKKLTGGKINLDLLKTIKVTPISKREQLEDALKQISTGKTNLVIVDVGILKHLEQAKEKDGKICKKN